MIPGVGRGGEAVIQGLCFCVKHFRDISVSYNQHYHRCIEKSYLKTNPLTWNDDPDVGFQGKTLVIKPVSVMVPFL